MPAPQPGAAAGRIGARNKYTVPQIHANFNKRLIKSPKLYFLDSGLMCWLLGIQAPEQLTTHPLRGAIFET